MSSFLPKMASRVVNFGEGLTQWRDHLKARLAFTPFSRLLPHDPRALDRSEKFQILLGSAYLGLVRSERLGLALTLAMVAEGQNNERAFRRFMRRAFVDAERLEGQADLSPAQLERLLMFRLAMLDLEGARLSADRRAVQGMVEAQRALADINAVELECSSWRGRIDEGNRFLCNRVLGTIAPGVAGDIVVQIPGAAFRSNIRDYKGFRKDIRRVFATIFETIERQGLNCIVTARVAKHGPMKSARVPVISYHTIGERAVGLHVKETDRPHFFSADPTGYSGWSTFGGEPITRSERTAAAEAFVEADRKQQLAGNVSKYEQPERGGEILPPNYLFVPLQVIDDAVQRLAHMHMFDMLEEVSRTARRHGLDVVVKRHPLCKSRAVSLLLARGQRLGWFQLSEASIHTLIERSAALCVVNSGVGAEALLHGKPVYTFGACDYRQATRVIRRRGEFERVFAPGQHPVASEHVAVVLHRMRTEYAVDMRDAEAARSWWDRKIRSLLAERV